jgi:hypothetical protein
MKINSEILLGIFEVQAPYRVGSTGLADLVSYLTYTFLGKYFCATCGFL